MWGLQTTATQPEEELLLVATWKELQLAATERGTETGTETGTGTLPVSVEGTGRG